MDRVNVTTGARELLRTIRVDDPAGVMTVGGATATADGKSYAFMPKAQSR